jgi:hypothetical protein
MRCAGPECVCEDAVVVAVVHAKNDNARRPVCDVCLLDYLRRRSEGADASVYWPVAWLTRNRERSTPCDMRASQDGIAPIRRGQVYVAGMAVRSGSGEFAVEEHQAEGIVAEQAHCDIGEAIALLSAECAAHGRLVHDVAVDVISGVIRFDRP